MGNDFGRKTPGLEAKLIHEVPAGASVTRFGEVWLIAGPDIPPYTVDFDGNVTPFPRLTDAE